MDNRMGLGSHEIHDLDLPSVRETNEDESLHQMT
jgi:hypothetical protein